MFRGKPRKATAASKAKELHMTDFAGHFPLGADGRPMPVVEEGYFWGLNG
jgi:hypothetical protein